MYAQNNFHITQRIMYSSVYIRFTPKSVFFFSPEFDSEIALNFFFFSLPEHLQMGTFATVNSYSMRIATCNSKTEILGFRIFSSHAIHVIYMFVNMFEVEKSNRAREGNKTNEFGMEPESNANFKLHPISSSFQRIRSLHQHINSHSMMLTMNWVIGKTFVLESI